MMKLTTSPPGRSVTVDLVVVPVNKPDDMNVIVGQTHFIKSVDENMPVAATADDGMKSTIAAIMAHRAVMTRSVQTI